MEKTKQQQEWQAQFAMYETLWFDTWQRIDDVQGCMENSTVGCEMLLKRIVLREALRDVMDAISAARSELCEEINASDAYQVTQGVDGRWVVEMKPTVENA